MAPIGITNCLNFGNPERPEVFFQFEEACRGISDACRFFETPVTGGNVSFYNENPEGAIPPTPVIGMIGMLNDVSKTVGSHFGNEGDVILLVGNTKGHLGGSALWAYVLDTVGGTPPPVDLKHEHQLQRLLVALADSRLVRSAHDLSEGGLAFGLAESCIGGPYASGTFGASINLDGILDSADLWSVMFGEDHGRVILSVDPARLEDVRTTVSYFSLPCHDIGSVGKSGGLLAFCRNGETFSADSESLREDYFNAIPCLMQQATSQLEDD